MFDNQSFFIVGIALAVVICFILILLIILKYVRAVQNTSTQWQELNRINDQYSFYRKMRLSCTRTICHDEKYRFDRFGPYEMLTYLALNDTELLNTAIKLQQNRIAYADYTDRIASLTSSVTPETAKSLHLSYRLYRWIERLVVRYGKLSPKLNGRITCNSIYITPKRRRKYTRSCTFTFAALSGRYDEIMRVREQQSTEEYRRRRERAKLSPKLRYRILQRDNFRCQICGRTQVDGVVLHVDHILPVSKGGQTVESNLRTLCSDCNLGKGADYESSSDYN